MLKEINAKRKYLGLSILFLIIIVLFYSCHRTSIENKRLPRAIKTYQIKGSAEAQEWKFSGTIEAENAADLSFQVPGQIKELVSKLGTFARKGEVLATLDQTTHLLEVQSAEASLLKAKANLMKIESYYRAKKELLRKNYVSRIDFQTAESDYKAAITDVNVADSSLQTAKENLQKTQLIAPFDGYLVKTYVDRHMFIQAGTSVMRFEGTGNYKIDVNIPDTLIHFIKLNEDVKVELITLNHLQLNGVITEIGKTTSVANVYPIVVEIKNPPEQVRSGMVADVILKLAGNTASSYYFIPINSILPGTKLGSLYVFIFDRKTSRVKKQEIKISGTKDNFAIVESGLKAGDIIATSGVRFLEDGQEVTLYQEQP